MFQHDLAFRNFQMRGQKTAQGRITLSFHCRRAELYLDGPSMFARDDVDLRVWHDVNSDSRHWLSPTLYRLLRSSHLSNIQPR